MTAPIQDPAPGDAAGRDPARTRPVVVHSSLRGLASAAFSPTALILIGGAAVISAGPRPVALGVLLFGVALGLVAVMDVPRRSVLDGSGITRVCALRRHHLPWERVVALERAPGSYAARVRNLTGSDDEVQISGGLVARGPGRKRWLLADRVESRAEYEEVAGLLRAAHPVTVLRASRPHAGAPPTDLYRRRQR